MGATIRLFHISLATLLIAGGVILPQTLGMMQSDYHWTDQYLSELGASGASNAAIMNSFGFLPVGLLWLAAISILVLRLSGGVLMVLGGLLLAGTSVSYVGAFLFPCDAGCPLEGSEKQLMHNLLGVVGYLTTPLGLVFVAIRFLSAKSTALALLTFAAAFLATIGFLMMASSVDAPLKGAWQRLADFTLFFWMFAVAFFIRDSSQHSI
ncbi:MAG: DUF998 domain-containing protein [Pseudomonadota bacterium]